MANRTYEYNPTGGSPVINVTAGAELKTAVAVLLTKDGAKIPEAGKEATGIVLLGDETVAKGDDITVQIRNQVCLRKSVNLVELTQEMTIQKVLQR